MAAQVESLVLKVLSDDVSRASKRLDRLERSAKGAEASSKKLSSGSRSLGLAIARVAGPVAAAAAAMAAFKKAMDIGIQTQDFKARLKTATGSVEDAAEAFEALEHFAKRTPFQLEQSLDAFIKLTNLGLTPSERALESYGNTAAAMGKDLTQFIEAVADATTNEFERLKEFGIKTKQQGDQVSFTFRGMTKTIGKNAAEIEEYLMSLGENEFAGAMADQMDTLGGKVSNLGDSWNELWRTINEAGVDDLLQDTVQTGIDILNELIALIKSGQLENGIKSWTTAFEEFADDFESVMGFVTELFGDAVDEWGEDGRSFFEDFVRNLKLFPATVRYWMQRVGIEVTTIAMYGVTAVEGLVNVFVQGFKTLLATAKTYGIAVAQALNPFDDTDFREAFRKASQEQAETFRKAGENVKGIFKESQDEIELWTKARVDSLEKIALDFGSVADRIDGFTEKAREVRIKYDLENAGPLEEVLGKHKKGGDGTTTQKLDEKTKKEFDKLVKSLQAEERALEGSYLKRLDLIRKNTEAGSALRAELEEKVRLEYEDSLRKFEERQIAELDFMQNGWSLQLEELKKFYEKRHILIMNSEALTLEEKEALVLEKEREMADLVGKMQRERTMQGLEAAKDMFGDYAKLAESSNRTLSRIGKTALAGQKAIAIAQTIMKTYESATSAYASMAGIPVVGPALGAAAAGAAIAAGMANVAAIRSAPSAGSFSSGGVVGGSSYSGDNLTANVNSAEMILTQRQQRRLFDLANGGSSGGGGITIINQTSGRVDQVSDRTLPTGERQIIIREAVNAMESKLTREVITGGGTVFPAGESTYNWKRTGT